MRLTYTRCYYFRVEQTHVHDVNTTTFFSAYTNNVRYWNVCYVT